MKFLVTNELGKLALWLRILGFDTDYFRDPNLSALIIQALKDERIILTRNHRLPKKSGIKIIRIKSEKVKEQLKEVLKELNASINRDIMFTRCTICNSALKALDKENARNRVPEHVFETQNNFFTCPDCKRIYWEGTHWGNVVNVLKEIE